MSGAVVRFFFLIVAIHLSRGGSVCFASDYEFVDGGGKVRKLDAGGNFFQNRWSSNAGCGCLLIFHVDPIRV